MAFTRRGFLTAAGLTAAGAMTGCGRGQSDHVSVVEWAELRTAVRGALLRPGEPGYENAAAPKNLRFSGTMPEAVVQCNNADDVAATVRWARKTGTHFAIRGGGNGYSNASNSSGVLISTRRMNGVRISDRTLIVGGGALNSDLAAALPQDGKGELLLPTGDCRTLGVLGQTLGGGVGPNTPWAGLTADRLRKATVVTADGTIVTASARENPDLFWALRGAAGANFGVVTEAEYEPAQVPTQRVTTASLVFPGRDAALSAALAFQRLRAQADRIISGDLHLRHTPDDAEATLDAQVLNTEAAARDLLAPLLRIPGVIADITERPWWDSYATSLKDPPPPRPFWNRSLYAEDYLPEDTLHAAVDLVARFPAARVADERRGSLHLYGWVGGAVNDVAADATAYVHRRARMLLETSTWWAPPGSFTDTATPIPKEMQSWTEELWGVLLPHTTGRSYQNFPDPELEDWGRAYYGDNLVRLEAVKSTWDPDKAFEFSQGIPLPR